MHMASDLLSIINACIDDHWRDQKHAWAAYIVPGSWNPKEGTVRAHRLHLVAVQSEKGDPPLYDVDLPLLTSSYGHQYGPRGYERCTIIPRPHGYAVILEHDETTSPQAPSGEHFLTHYNKTGKIDSSIKFTNDGPAAGDGKAGIVGMVGALLSFVTKGGLSLRIDDAANRVVVTAPLVELGADNLDAANNAVIRKTDLDAALSAQAAQFQTQLRTWAAASVQGGSGAGGPSLTAVTSHGSTTVRATS